MTPDPQTSRKRLDAERLRVVAALEHLRRQHPGSLDDEVDESHLDNHLAETATVTVDREIDYSLEESELRVLQAIDDAIARLDEGTYGRCERCGGEIEAERLEALPWATLCIEDKRKDEQS